MKVRAASQADIPFIMRAERLEGNDGLVGRWEESAHRTEMANSSSAYLILESPEAEALGFVMLQKLDEPNGNVLLRRIAVIAPGEGLGQALLQAVAAFVFARPCAHRLHLIVHAGNARAHRAYAKAGWVQEGVEREGHRRPDGAREDNIVLSILRPEWEARP